MPGQGARSADARRGGLGKGWRLTQRSGSGPRSERLAGGVGGVQPHRPYGQIEGVSPALSRFRGFPGTCSSQVYGSVPNRGSRTHRGILFWCVGRASFRNGLNGRHRGHITESDARLIQFAHSNALFCQKAGQFDLFQLLMPARRDQATTDGALAAPRRVPANTVSRFESQMNRAQKGLSRCSAACLEQES